MAPRSVPGTIPASLVPDVLRAAGFYPSQADVDVMMAHLAFIAAFRDLGDDGSVLQVLTKRKGGCVNTCTLSYSVLTLDIITLSLIIPDGTRTQTSHCL